MAIETPPTIDPAPVPGPQRGDESTFDDRMDAKIRWDETSAQQYYASSLNVAHNAQEALNYASTAQTAANNAATYRDAAMGYRDDAQGFANTAMTYRDQAAASASAAAASSTSLTATSSTAVALGAGSKTFTIAAGKQYPVATYLQVISTGTQTARMFGNVTSYSGTTLALNVTAFEGPAGTYSDWAIAPGGATGATGGTAGGNLTSALNELKGASPASSATPDVWNAGGNYVPITQTAAITGLPNAPQAGARRTLKAESTFPVTSSANFFVHGGSTTINPGDELDIVADTVSTFLVTVRRNSGAVGGGFRNMEALKTSQIWTARVTGLHRIMLRGASGSGGVAIGKNSARVAASGASTGGTSIKTFFANAGDSFTLVLGSRGASVTLVGQPGDQALNGNDAGDSTFVGPGVSLICGGGKKGNGAVATSGTTVAAGAVGGTASGGDLNFAGGDSGTASTASPLSAVATGGAGAAHKGPGFSSGSITLTGASGNGLIATGGASVGGVSGSVTGVNLTSVGSGGAGANGRSSNITAGVGVGGVGVDADFTSAYNTTPLRLVGAGSNAGNNATSGSVDLGAGSGAVYALDNNVQSGGSTLDGGTGGVAGRMTSSGFSITSGDVLRGGASGGVAVTSNTISACTLKSGDGGQAYAIIESP